MTEQDTTDRCRDWLIEAMRDPTVSSRWLAHEVRLTVLQLESILQGRALATQEQFRSLARALDKEPPADLMKDPS